MNDDALSRAKKILDEHDRIKMMVVGQNHTATHLAARGSVDLQALGAFTAAELAVRRSIEDELRLKRQIDEIIRPYRHLDNDIASIHAVGSATKIIAAYESRFYLPGFEQTEKMLDAMRGNFFGSVLERYGNQLPGAQQAMLAMQAPWLDTLHAERSLRGFAELQAIGHSLGAVPSFGDEFTVALRGDLGDWRDPITSWSVDVFTDTQTRRGFYVDRGLNTELTDFPEVAFHESLAIAGVTGDTPILVANYGELNSLFISSEDEVALTRTNVAHNWLQRFEFQLRKFIDESMTKAFGATWPKHRLPNGFYESWKTKKAADTDRGLHWPLIAYADFTEYAAVICRTDNWKEIFQATFGRKESVTESFQRLYAIRIATSHARPITSDDELLLFVEVKRLLNALKPIN